MEFVGAQFDLCEVLVADLDAGRVGVGVQLRMDFQAVRGRGRGDQADDDLEAHQGLAAPVLGNETEEAVLDLVPLACAWREVANGYG